MPTPSQKNVTDHIRDSVERAVDKTRKVGGKLANALSETPEYVSLQRNGRALKSELEESYIRIGKRARLLDKRAKGEGPFGRYKTIQRELERIDLLESEYRENKQQLASLKRRVKKTG